MAEYKTGVVKTATGYADFLYQNQEGNMDGDEVTAKDENGNTAASEVIDPRALVNITAIVPKNQSIPAKGATVVLNCTVSESGISFPDSGGTDTNFMVESSKIVQGNERFTEVNLGLKRYLKNSLPASS
jgi:hypothetical protein